ncbi:MAG: hypothetical protein RLZZ540_631 [Bacteroidota bacterium]
MLLNGYRLILNKVMAETKENQIDNKAFTEECNAVLMAVSDALYAISGK